MGGTQVDDLLDVESQKRFTAILIFSNLASLWSGMPIWRVVIGISAQNLSILHRISIFTVGHLFGQENHDNRGPPLKW